MTDTASRRLAATAGDSLKSLALYPLPHHLLSRLVFAVTRVRAPAWKNLLIDGFIRRYRVDLGEAQQSDPHAYPDFNSFFTRALRPGARPISDQPGDVCCPVDGTVSQAGAISAGRLFQAKGRDYSLVQLLGGSQERAAPFAGGRFVTLYLSPRDYHRIHMPCTGQLQETIHVPGRLFGVGPHCVRAIPNLFARNERLISIFDSEAGPLAVIMVGALFVGSLETTWSGVVTPLPGRRPGVVDYRSATPIHLHRGQELGRFNMGSTVIVLFAQERVALDPGLISETPVCMGQRLGRLITY
ncbi:MAG: phosphatidylserine decarboxylase [Gammaproteobacteria bacterium]|nr:phosphatidylserine decarboxylase [Gammaproteobacteria bacterium]